MPIPSALPLRTVRGTLDELGRVDATAPGWLRVYVRERPRAGLREAVQDMLPNALEVRIDPDVLADLDPAGARAPRQVGRGASELFAEYLHVAGPRRHRCRRAVRPVTRRGRVGAVAGRVAERRGTLMRPLRIDMAGFAAFREPTTVDFTDADFFALVGPTGSGKSTVLDAICFALYGTVPRWNDRRAIANALAPSTAEARVRLIFESAGRRYAATRVVRRDGKGRVTTSHAGLELLPQGFDLGRLDTGLDAGDLGDPLAGTPAEMDAAVLDAVGLPFEQFTSCVVLPQGQFAEFLHAKPAATPADPGQPAGPVGLREGTRAGHHLAAEADAHLSATDRQLTELADADDAVAAAAAVWPSWSGSPPTSTRPYRRWRKRGWARSRRGRALATLDGELATLAAGSPHPASGRRGRGGDDRPGGRRTTRRRACWRPRSARRSCATSCCNAGDAAELRRLIDAHGERAQLVDEAGSIAAMRGDRSRRAREVGGGA